MQLRGIALAHINIGKDMAESNAVTHRSTKGWYARPETRLEDIRGRLVGSVAQSLG